MGGGSGQRTAMGSQLFRSTMWVLGIELKSSGLAAKITAVLSLLRILSENQESKAQARHGDTPLLGQHSSG